MRDRHEANRRHWDRTAARWQALRDADGGWRRCHLEPELGLPGQMRALIQRYVGRMNGRRACVLGSGDNYATFALAGLGAQVTSVDMSQAQLDVARSRADSLGLSHITFCRADVTALPESWSQTFDLACSTNGVAVWLEDMPAYYREARRILRPGGVLITYDVHPFQRPWADSIELRMEKPYFASGPKEEIDGLAGTDAHRTYEAHWTMGELLMGITASGLDLAHVLEEPARDAGFWQGSSYVVDDCDTNLLDWRINARAGLPVWLTLVARRMR